MMQMTEEHHLNLQDTSVLSPETTQKIDGHLQTSSSGTNLQHKPMAYYCVGCRKTTSVMYDHRTRETVCMECNLVLDSGINLQHKPMPDYCADCRKTTSVMYDHGTGDTVCMECGLILEALSIDETTEWRTPSDDCNNDRNRVGFASNPLSQFRLSSSSGTNLQHKPMADYCASCRKITPGMYDHGTGDTVCMECGLILYSGTNLQDKPMADYCAGCRKTTTVIYNHGPGDTVCMERSLVLDSETNLQDKPMADYCAGCRKTTTVMYDHGTGDTVCIECGLILEAHSIDETAEWRTPSDDCTSDPNRVGFASNPLLDDNPLYTYISHTPDSLNSGIVTPKWPSSVRSKKSNKKLMEGFEGIAKMSDRLSLVSTVTDRAKEIFKYVEDHKIKFRKLRCYEKNVIYAACLSIACDEEHKARTLKEIITVANDATRKEVNRAKSVIERDMKKEIGENKEEGCITNPIELVTRFSAALSLRYLTIKAVKEALKKSEELDIRRSPSTMAAVVIYMLTEISLDEKKDLQEISDATGVSVNTIKSAYKQVYPYASTLIPSYYALINSFKDSEC